MCTVLVKWTSLVAVVMFKGRGDKRSHSLADWPADIIHCRSGDRTVMQAIAQSGLVELNLIS